MSDEEIQKRMEELSYLKIPPREQEANNYLLMAADNLYEELIGDDRITLEFAIRTFENALESRDDEQIAEAYTELTELMNELGEEI